MVGDLCGSVCAYGRACIVVWPPNRTVRRGAHLRHLRPAIGDAASSPTTCTAYCGRRTPPATALSRRAQRGGDSIRPGPAGQTCSRSPPRPRPGSSQPGPSPALMFRTCLRRRLRVACNRRGFDCAYVEARIFAELPIRVVRRRVRLRHSAASHRRCDLKLTACATCCGWRLLSTAARSRRVLRGGDSI